MYPNCSKPLANPSTLVPADRADAPDKKPIRAVFFSCCARTELSPTSKIQEPISPISKEPRTANRLFGFGFNIALSNHFIRPRQYVRRNRETDLFGCFQVDHQLKLHGLL